MPKVANHVLSKGLCDPRFSICNWALNYEDTFNNSIPMIDAWITSLNIQYAYILMVIMNLLYIFPFSRGILIERKWKEYKIYIKHKKHSQSLEPKQMFSICWMAPDACKGMRPQPHDLPLFTRDSSDQTSKTIQRAIQHPFTNLVIRILMHKILQNQNLSQNSIVSYALCQEEIKKKKVEKKG